MLNTNISYKDIMEMNFEETIELYARVFNEKANQIFSFMEK